MKKKLLFIPFILIFIISIFAIYSSADYNPEDYPNGIYFENDTIITLKQNIPSDSNYNNYLGTINFNFLYKYNSNEYNQTSTYINLQSNGRMFFKLGESFVSVVGSGKILNQYLNIKVLGNQTITNENQIRILCYIAESGLPEPPPPPPDPMDTVYYDGNGFLNNTHQNINTIINFITGNTVIAIFTIGIFLISIAVGLMARLRRKRPR